MEKGLIPLPFLVAIAIYLTVLLTLIYFDPLSKLFQVKEKGTSKWATFRNIKKMEIKLLRKNGFVLGRYRPFFWFSIPLVCDEPLCLLVVAPSGTGKTSGVVIPSILNSDDATLIINDPKGEIYNLTAGHRRTLGPVFRIEWASETDDTHCWNPLALENLPESYEGIANYVERFSAILINSKKEDDFWAPSARDLLASTANFLILLNKRNNQSATLFDIYKFLSDLDLPGTDEEKQPGKNALHMAADLCTEFDFPEGLRADLLSVANMDYRTKSGVLAHVRTKIRIFSNPSVIRVTSRCDLDIKNIREKDGKPQTVYFTVPASDQATFGKLTGIFVDLMSDTLTRERDQSKFKRPIRVILDELAFLPAMRTISEMPAYGRSYNLAFMNVCQDYEQIKHKWGEETLETLLTNSPLQVVLTQNSYKTSEKISLRIGHCKEPKFNRSFSWGRQRNRSVSVSEEKIRLIEPQDILDLKSGEQIVFVRGNSAKPILAHSVRYYKSAKYKKILAKAKMRKGQTTTNNEDENDKTGIKC